MRTARRHGDGASAKVRETHASRSSTMSLYEPEAARSLHTPPDGPVSGLGREETRGDKPRLCRFVMRADALSADRWGSRRCWFVAFSLATFPWFVPCASG